MVKYVLRRALGWIAMIFIATNATYLLANLFLDPRSNYLEMRPPRTEEQISAALAPYNLDPQEPLISRWWTWLTNILLHWDWGYSPVGVSVNAEVGYRMVISAQLLAAGTILSVLIGVAVGVWSASRQYSLLDRVSQAVAILLLNLPTVILGLLLVLLAVNFNQAVGHQVFLVTGTAGGTGEGFWPDLWDRLRRLFLPTLSLVITGYVGYHLSQCALLLDTIHSDYVRTARATGLTRAQAIRRHALPTALIPTATSVAFTIPGLFTGSVITEMIFGWQGMGTYFTETISKNDIHGTVAVAAFGALATAVGAILADIATAALDPRVRVN